VSTGSIGTIACKLEVAREFTRIACERQRVRPVLDIKVNGLLIEVLSSLLTLPRVVVPSFFREAEKSRALGCGFRPIIFSQRSGPNPWREPM
jgi:hypothetical protein